MESSSSVAVSTDSTEAPRTTSAEPAPKKKRNLSGMPDPEAEVIALSPNSLLATNRFVCEICSKGFQRDQNLQLHRRGHNLPWKLKQKAASDQVRKRVYVCPETTCVHHSPSRALGDLTGIKKHFCRKHGEKKWKCERCSKKYAVQSDWKAHMKVCGTKEYKCICGTVFSRRDSFITHRAFCDALTEESSKVQEERTVAAPLLPPSPPPPRSPSTATVSPALSVGSDLPENAPEPVPPPAPPAICAAPAPTPSETTTSGGAPPPQPATPSISNIICPVPELTAADPVAEESLPSPSSTEPSASLSLFLSTTASSMFSRQEQSHRLYTAPSQPQPPAMSATALLQKAAQMGATSSNGSLLQGLGLAISSTYDNTTTTTTSTPSSSQWGEPDRFDRLGLGYGLGLGLASEESPSIMVPQSSLFGAQPMTLDFLGLGGPRVGLSALLTTLEGGLGAGSPAPCSRSSKGGTWEPFDSAPS